MVKEKDIVDLVNKHRNLFWSVSDNNLNKISKEVVVETILNLGSIEDIKEMFAVLGLNDVAKIFYKQIQHKRNNYTPLVKNYFDLYFKKYAS